MRALQVVVTSDVRAIASSPLPRVNRMMDDLYRGQMEGGRQPPHLFRENLIHLSFSTLSATVSLVPCERWRLKFRLHDNELIPSQQPTCFQPHRLQLYEMLEAAGVRAQDNPI